MDTVLYFQVHTIKSLFSLGPLMLWFFLFGVSVSNRSIRTQQASSTHQCKCEENVCMYSCCVVLCVLAVTYISVIYKFLSLGLWSAARSGQAKLKLAKPSHRHGKQSTSVSYHMVGRIIHSALREEQGWTHSLQCWQHLVAQVCLNCLLLIKRDNFHM